MDPASLLNALPLTNSTDEFVPVDMAPIPVIEEQIRIEKRIVETGRVLIEKHVSERQETVTVPLQHDEVNVDRILVNRYVDSPPAIRYEGDTMIIPVLEEVVVIEKRLMLVEELHVTKRQVQTQETQQVTLRTESVAITRQPGTVLDDAPTEQVN